MERIPLVWPSDSWIVLSAELCYIIRYAINRSSDSVQSWKPFPLQEKTVFNLRLNLLQCKPHLSKGVGARFHKGYTCFQLRSVPKPGAVGKHCCLNCDYSVGSRVYWAICPLLEFCKYKCRNQVGCVQLI